VIVFETVGTVSEALFYSDENCRSPNVSVSN